MTVADNALLRLTTGMTLEAWVWPAAASTDWATAILKERPGDWRTRCTRTDGANKPPAGYINRNGTDVEAAGTSVLALERLDPPGGHVRRDDHPAVRQRDPGREPSADRQHHLLHQPRCGFGGNTVWGEYFNGLLTRSGFTTGP